MASTVFSENLITDPDLLQAVEGEVFARLRASAGPQQTACLDQIALCSIQKDQAIFTFSLAGVPEDPEAQRAVQQALQRAVETVFDLPAVQVDLSASQAVPSTPGMMPTRAYLQASPAVASPPAIPPDEAAKAWQNALAHLRLQIPHPVFEQYLQQAVSPAFDRHSGVFTVSVADDYTREWLQSRLTKIVARILSGLLNQAVTLQFLATDPATAQVTWPGLPEVARPPDMPDAGTELGSSLESSARLQVLDEAKTSLREAFIDRNQIVNFPAYLLRWLPCVGPKAVALAIAFRQARYLAAGCSLSPKNAGEPFSVSAKEIYRWAGISRATFFRLLDSVELQWFIKKVASPEKWAVDPETGGVKQAPNRYQFTAFAPLTPTDAQDLYQYLVKAGVQEDPVKVLTRLSQEIQPRQVWQFPPPSPGGGPGNLIPQVTTVYSVVMQTIRGTHLPPGQARDGAFLAEISGLAEKLEERLTGGNVQLSWYFWTDLMPLLKETAGMLVVYLRSLGYYNRKTGEINDEIWIENGADEIARLLNLGDVRSIVRWFPPITRCGQPKKEAARVATRTSRAYDQAKREMIGLFLERQTVKRNRAGRYAWKIKVAFADPLTPGDQALYDDLWEALAGILDACQAGELEAQAVLDLIETTHAAQAAAKTESQPEAINDKTRHSKPGQNDSLRRILYDKERLRQWLTNDKLRLLNDKIKLVKVDENDRLKLDQDSQNDNLRWFKITKVLNTLREILTKLPDFSAQTRPQLLTQERWVGQTDPPERWDLATLIQQNVFSPDYRVSLTRNTGRDARPLISWLIHCSSPSRGKGVADPVSVTLVNLERRPGVGAGGACDRLARLAPSQLLQLLIAELNHAGPLDLPGYADWRAVMGGATQAQLVNLADCLGLGLDRQT